MISTRSAVAAARFGLGARPGELSAIGADPEGWLLGQLDPGVATPAELAGLKSGAERTRELLTARGKAVTEIERLVRQDYRRAYLSETGARTLAHIRATLPFRERLVAFWSNHFTVSTQRPMVSGLVGAFEREAIRPYVVGRFRDMLGAVVRHPAMLLYLDNAASIGPESRAGRRSGRGLNENLAREVMELHTLGVNGGYTQSDVREFARILTGWSVAPLRDPKAGTFAFQDRLHEPGRKTVLGVTYRETGVTEGDDALTAFSRHPATARHIATKLARHFVADDPPAPVVQRLASIFAATDGDLDAIARALVATPEAWDPPLTKVKTPYDLAVSALRAVNFAGDPSPVVASLREFAQLPFAAPSPAGWPDTADAWIGPESMMRRIEWSLALAQRIGDRAKPLDLADQALGPLVSTETRHAMSVAPSAEESLALLFSSPEFQRR